MLRRTDPERSRRKRPKRLHAAEGYDCIARRDVESDERLGWHRWAVKRMLPWLSYYRRLKVRCERGADFHQVFLDLGCALICWGYVRRFC